MPNRDEPNGFTPFRHRGGGVIRAGGPYKVEHGYTTALYTGDAVILSSGFVVRAADNSATILGIFAGCKYRATDGSVVISNYWPASTATLGDEDVEAFVFDDPKISYRVQTDTGTAYVDATHKGWVFDIELDHAGSAITGQSGMEIDLNDTGTGQFKVIGLIDEADNAAGVNAKVEVVINTEFLA
jgi:hypothetical protein